MKAGDTIGCKEINKTFVIDEVIMGIAHFEWDSKQFQLGVRELIMLGYEVVKETSPINALFKRHYNAIVKRGLIDKNTTTNEFHDKLHEELDELNDVWTCKEEFVKEATDCIHVLVNMLIHEGVDIEKELIKNIEHNETRKD